MLGHPGSTARPNRQTPRAATLGILGALVLIVAITAPAAATTGYPPHDVLKVACRGQYLGATSLYIDVYEPVIYAMNTVPGPETQLVAFQVALSRWNGTQWIDDPEAGGWGAWQFRTKMDLDHTARYSTIDASLSGVTLRVPRWGNFYAVSFRVAWYVAATGTWVIGPSKWVGAHLNQVNTGWIADSTMLFQGCKYIPTWTYINL